MDLDRLEVLGRGVEQQPEDADGWLALAEALLDHRASELARPMLARAKACELTRAEQWKFLAELALRLGDRAAARHALRTTVGLDENDVAAVAWFARVAVEDGEAEEAVPILKKTLARGDHPELRRWLVQAVAACRPAPTTPAKPVHAAPPPVPTSSSARERKKRGVAVMSSGSANGSHTNFTGDLTVFSLPEMLEFLAQQRSTGTLQILSKQHSANVHLIEGRITDVEHPLRPSLVAMLNERGQSISNRLHALPIEVMTDEAALCRALVEQGIVSASAVEDALRARIEDGVFRVLQWSESYAQFRAGQPTPQHHPGFDAQWVLLSAMHRLDEGERS